MEINKTVKKDLYMIDPKSVIVISGFNSRVDFDIEPLAESIKTHGVLNPVTVIRTDTEDGERYRLVDGERRYRAVMKCIEDGIEIARIPAICVPKMSDADMLTQQVVRNDGKPFNEYEYAIACKKFRDYGFTNKEISEKIGKNDGMVTYYLDHLSRDERIQKLLSENKISGAEVRRIYKEHKNRTTGKIDEEAAVNEILGAEKRSKDNGGDGKVTLAMLDPNGKTIVSRDSDIIKKGLSKLLFYFKKFSENGNGEIELDIMDVLDSLNKNMMITEVFEQALEKNRKEAV